MKITLPQTYSMVLKLGFIFYEVYHFLYFTFPIIGLTPMSKLMLMAYEQVTNLEEVCIAGHKKRLLLAGFCSLKTCNAGCCVFFLSVLTNICAPFLLHFFPFLSFSLPSVWMYGLQDSPTKSEASGNCFICVHALSLFLLQLLNVVIFPVFTRTVPKTALAQSPTLTLFKHKMRVNIDFGKNK